MGRAPCCDKDKVKRGPWSPEEDAELKAYIEKNGTGGNWISLPQRAGLKRCGKSCRLRWLNYLRPEIKHGGFTAEEDAMICALYRALGSRWSVIASRLPGRTDNDVKNYWNTKLKKRYADLQRQKDPGATAAASCVDYSPLASPISSTTVPHPAAVSTAPSSTAQQSLLPLAAPTTTTTTATTSCAYPYLPPVDYTKVGHAAVRTTTSSFPSRHPVFLSSSIDATCVVPHRITQDDVSSFPSRTSAPSPSSMTADYASSSSAISFGSTMVEDYIQLPTYLQDASTSSGAAAATPSSSSLTMDHSSGVGYQPWAPELDESFFAEAEAAFESYYFSSSSTSTSANVASWSGACAGPYDGTSGAASDSGLLWDLVVDSAYSYGT